ncbi:GATA transcription factor 1 [Forsythia ovata]|uniref:GATA transcription factor 1 n=1 Tax=Forsythia ovata TaxID=205694 RepID=A0ABD1V0P6_9LAMI
MENLDITEANFMVDDDLLNFTLDGEGEENEDPKTVFKGPFASSSSSSLESSNPSTVINPETQSGSFPECQEEELEWLSNKDAFPEVETCLGILSNDPELMLNCQSPVSFENSSSSSNNVSGNNSGSTVASCCGSLKVPRNYPVRTRSNKRKRRVALGNLTSQQCLLDQVNVKKSRQESPLALPPLPMRTNNGATMGRRCLHCQVDKTPQWRAGPMGPKTLCNACGVRYKSGRLFPEYRPASSPTFSGTLHSNSHRKVIEMRRQKQLSTGGGITVSEARGYRV